MSRSNTETMRVATIGLPDYVRLKMLNLVSNDYYLTDCMVNLRDSKLRAMQRNAVNGKVAIAVWSRDCDCAESTHVEYIAPTLLEYQMLAARHKRNAEGPVTFTVLTPEEAEEFQPEVRDRVLEAFENGHNYNV